MNDDSKDVAPEDLVNIPTDLGNQFTEIFIKDPENVHLVLSFLTVSVFSSSSSYPSFDLVQRHAFTPPDDPAADHNAEEQTEGGARHSPQLSNGCFPIHGHAL